MPVTVPTGVRLRLVALEVDQLSVTLPPPAGSEELEAEKVLMVGAGVGAGAAFTVMEAVLVTEPEELVAVSV